MPILAHYTVFHILLSVLRNVVGEILPTLLTFKSKLYRQFIKGPNLHHCIGNQSNNVVSSFTFELNLTFDDGHCTVFRNVFFFHINFSDDNFYPFSIPGLNWIFHNFFLNQMNSHSLLHLHKHRFCWCVCYWIL